MIIAKLDTIKGKRIKIQANYECLQALHSCKAQGGMRAKPDMKPWVNPDKSGLSSVRSGTFGASICPWECHPLQGSSMSSLSLYYFDALALMLCNGFHEVKKKYLSLH